MYLSHLYKETPSCESALNVLDVSDKSCPVVTVEFVSSDGDVESWTETEADCDVCMSMTCDNGTGTMCDEAAENTGMTVCLGMWCPSEVSLVD